VVYAPEKAQRAKENFFKEPTLAALREMALRQTAHEVDLRQVTGDRADQAESAATSQEKERILIHVTDSPSAVGLIRRGRRVADYLRADCFAVAVVPHPGFASLPGEQRDALERHLDFARKLHIDTRILDAEDAAEALVGFAQTNAVTQIFLTKPRKPRCRLFGAKQLLAMQVTRAARNIQVTVVADRQSPSP
jgi:two-component system sensor histidine kinase KdpD